MKLKYHSYTFNTDNFFINSNNEFSGFFKMLTSNSFYIDILEIGYYYNGLQCKKWFYSDKNINKNKYFL